MGIVKLGRWARRCRMAPNTALNKIDLLPKIQVVGENLLVLFFMFLFMIFSVTVLGSGSRLVSNSKPAGGKLNPRTLTLAAASRLAAKAVGDHLPSGLGRGQSRTIINTLYTLCRALLFIPRPTVICNM